MVSSTRCRAEARHHGRGSNGCGELRSLRLLSPAQARYDLRKVIPGRGQRGQFGHLSLQHARFLLRNGTTCSNTGGSMNESAPVVQMIPVNQINVLNPRSRNKIVFQSIVSNISNLGLKRPITVARRDEMAEGKLYDLVCGQGRLEAFMALGQTVIPAIVIEATKEECFLMSLVENVARR